MSFMPEVKMDFIPSDNESDNESENQSVEEDVTLPTLNEAEIKDDMNVDEIFNMPVVQPLETNIKLTKKGKPRKKRPPMSEEHKAKLALAREKAMAARKKKAQEKKENKALELEEKELLKKQKVKRVKKLKEEVEEVTPAPSLVKEQSFTKQDLEEAQLQAIMNYEKIRKSRKEQKKIQQEKDKEQQALRNQIRRAVAPPQKEYNMFEGCY